MLSVPMNPYLVKAVTMEGCLREGVVDDIGDRHL